MRDALAERLLAEVMGWEPEDIARERPDLQAMAAYKYDEYQQFSPGMRFMESLASWLGQLDAAERTVAYEFVKHRLIFCGGAEISHFVATAYPDHIRPLLIQEVARELGTDPRHVARVVNTQAFRVRLRRSLVLGLSDGARTDVFRRYNINHISQEQVRQTHEISADRTASLLASLRQDLESINGAEVEAALCTFRTLILLDDFSASGLSYIRTDDEGNLTGKIGRLHRALQDADGPMSRLMDAKQRQIILVLYMATEQARDHLNEVGAKIWEGLGVDWKLVVVHEFPSGIRIRPGEGDNMEPLIEAHYDASIQTQHTDIGGTDLKYGFAGCGLPLVLTHNTPNNSIALLWASTEEVRPLFPRVSRHKADI